MSENLLAPPAKDVKSQVLNTRKAARALARLSGDERNRILTSAADLITARAPEILAANKMDCDALTAFGGSDALARRLKATEQGVKEMAMRVRDVAAMDDPLGKVIATTELDDGLVLQKVPCPLGVVAVIFESRPDVIPQVGSLAIKTGNGLVLKGGVEAKVTNRVLATIWRDALAAMGHALPAAICLLEERAEIMQVLQMEREIDLVVPRGSSEFVNFVFRNSCIPVMGHGSGVCHIYVDRNADLESATKVILDSKTQYPAACNSAEKVLVHEDVARRWLPTLVTALQAAGVEVRGCTRVAQLCGEMKIVAATDEDWTTDYSDLKITVKVVRNLNEAIDHINQYGSRHTDCILTQDNAAAEQFLDEVDSASVMQNASTRFADGFRYGLGAEVGISNSKLHARGPVGMDGLLTYKYRLRGSGQVVATYADGTRHFKHRKL
jgi:glutamate-5-semialdehyde dehydrogenase